MRILLLPTTFSNNISEASQITLILLAKELKKNGHDVCVVSPGKKGFPTKEVFKGINIYRGPVIKFLGPFNKILSPLLKVKELKKNGIDFDIIQGFSAARFFSIKSVLAKILFNKKARIVHTLRSYPRSKIGKKYTKLLNFIDYITVSTKTYANILSNSGCKKDKIKIIRSPIDTSKFQPKDKYLSKKKVKIKQNFILYYGSSFENKGPRMLIEIMAKLLEKNKKWLLVMVLRHKTPKEYKILAKSKNIEKNVIFIGSPVKNIEDYVNAADIIVLPYKDMISTEGNPSCLIEAITCKTPVVTTNLPELREIVNPEKDVLMAKPNNTKSLIKKINNLINNKKLQKKLSENAYKKSKDFDIEKITGQYLKIYTKLIKNG